MEEIRQQDSGVYDWLRAIPASSWSRAHFSGRAKCDILLNNICESFNSRLVKGREKPIISCLEFVREYLMKRICVVQGVIDVSKGPLTPTATQILEVNKEAAEKYTVIFNGTNKYQVSGPWNDQCVVHMGERTCSCRKWELTGIPCKHAVATMNNMHKYGFEVGIPEDWVHTAYTLQTWNQVYSNKIAPIVGATYWPVSDSTIQILPPYHHTQVGRPKKKRKRGAFENNQPIVKGCKLSKAGRSITCGKCKQKGHNARNCRGQSENASQQRPRTQPSQPTEPHQTTQPSQPRATPSQASEAQQTNQASHQSQPTVPTHSIHMSQPTEPTHSTQPGSPPRRNKTESVRGPRPVVSPQGKRYMVTKNFSGNKVSKVSKKAAK
uniref:uncharacterized protein LOC122606079 n=1 Tax=Erigeron canadensis TaxID=72917 RepID=UPI001CB9C2E1|nr:uncharacterized protein LOC122606079 [Erigeron canadensis]